jgi:hypothetical protein
MMIIKDLEGGESDLIVVLSRNFPGGTEENCEEYQPK